MDHLISQFIDEELSLTEKVTFLEKVRNENAFYTEAISLIEQEQRLCQVLCDSTASELPIRTVPYRWLKPIGGVVAATLVVALSFFMGTMVVSKEGVMRHSIVNTPPKHRFILHVERSQSVEIAGSFTGWKRLELTRAGQTGYWEITLPVPDGEHRYAFILDGSIPIPDPTVTAREEDDFGTENSIVTFDSTTS